MHIMKKVFAFFLAALLLAAGFEGVQEKLPLPEPSNYDVYAHGRERGLTPLPSSLGQAVELAQKSAFLRSVIPEKILENYLQHKQREARAYTDSEKPYDYELRQYFSRV